MPGLRKFLIYEIPGLLIVLYTILFTFYFLDENTKRIILCNIGSIAQAALVLALPIGWLIYQIYDSMSNSFFDPHTCYKEVEYYWESILEQKKLPKDYYKALVDYILIEDMYKQYPGLADTIRGLWDHYDARYLIGIAVPICTAMFVFIASKFIFIDYSPCQIFLSAIYFIIIHFMLIFRGKGKILKQVHVQECILIHKNLEKLSKFKYNSCCIRHCLDKELH